jgi:hypothetical protein
MPAPPARVELDLRLAESSVALKPGDAILPVGSQPPHRGAGVAPQEVKDHFSRSQQASELLKRGAKGIRTPDLLHAI